MKLKSSKKISFVFLFLLVISLMFLSFIIAEGDELIDLNEVNEDNMDRINEDSFENQKEIFNDKGMNLEDDSFVEDEGSSLNVGKTEGDNLFLEKPPISFNPEKIEEYCREEGFEVEKGETCVNVTKEGLVFDNGAKFSEGEISFDEGNIVFEGIGNKSPEADLRDVDLNKLENKITVKGDNAAVKSMKDKYIDKTFSVRKGDAEGELKVVATDPIDVLKEEEGKYVPVGSLNKGEMTTQKKGLRYFEKENLDFEMIDSENEETLGRVKSQNFAMLDHLTRDSIEYEGDKGPLVKARKTDSGDYSLEALTYKEESFGIENIPKDMDFTADITGDEGGEIIEQRGDDNSLEIKHDKEGTKVNGKKLLKEAKKELEKEGFEGSTITKLNGEEEGGFSWNSEEGVMELQNEKLKETGGKEESSKEEEPEDSSEEENSEESDEESQDEDTSSTGFEKIDPPEDIDKIKEETENHDSRKITEKGEVVEIGGGSEYGLDEDTYINKVFDYGEDKQVLTSNKEDMIIYDRDTGKTKVYNTGEDEWMEGSDYAGYSFSPENQEETQTTTEDEGGKEKEQEEITKIEKETGKAKLTVEDDVKGKQEMDDKIYKKTARSEPNEEMKEFEVNKGKMYETEEGYRKVKRINENYGIEATSPDRSFAGDLARKIQRYIDDNNLDSGDLNRLDKNNDGVISHTEYHDEVAETYGPDEEPPSIEEKWDEEFN